MSYTLLDSGGEQKLEQFGDYTLIRPCAQALWKKKAPKLWKNAQASFTRGKPWKGVPKFWQVEFNGLTFKIEPTDFGHLGLFPEHAQHWEWMKAALKPSSEVLNLFAYSGAATLFLANEGHQVCHLDASKGMIDWAKENAKLNGLEKAPIRWIVDDALKFLKREVKRGRKYDGVLLDPPSFGRGAQGQVFKIERDLPELLELCKEVLSPSPSFILLTCHTPGMTPKVLEHLLEGCFNSLTLNSGEMLIPSKTSYPLPTGCYARGSG
jgi:23S rRNA (cytosine1962-C5)-methyltransferase